MSAHQNIIFVCSRLDLPGGIERAIVNTANLFASKGLDVTLLILDKTAAAFYPVDERIKIVQEHLHFGIIPEGNPVTRKVAFLKHLQQLKKILKQLDPDAIITTEYVFTIAARLAVKNEVKLIAWEHHHFHHLHKSKFWQYLFDRNYIKVDVVVCLNEKEKQFFSDAGCNAVVIPNFIQQQKKSELNSKVLLTIGWLSFIKGIDLIPQIAEIVFDKHKDWKWKIIGAGNEEQRFRASIQEKNLEPHFIFTPPVHHDLSEEYQNASMYVMTSRFECFPMVLLEAFSFGIPAIAFDCPTGPAFIIDHNKNGFLIKQNDVAAIAASIQHLIENEEKRKEMGEAAFESIEQFSPERIFDLWMKILEN